MAIRKKRRESVQQHHRRNLVKKREKVVRTLKMKLNKISFKRGKRGGGGGVGVKARSIKINLAMLSNDPYYKLVTLYGTLLNN